jgi:hypothetical protein
MIGVRSCGVVLEEVVSNVKMIMGTVNGKVNPVATRCYSMANITQWSRAADVTPLPGVLHFRCPMEESNSIADAVIENRQSVHIPLPGYGISKMASLSIPPCQSHSREKYKRVLPAVHYESTKSSALSDHCTTFSDAEHTTTT